MKISVTNYNSSLFKKKATEETKEVEEAEIDLSFLPPLLEPYQVADILGVSVRTVANYRELGFLNSFQVSSRKYKYKKTDVIKFLEERYVTDPFDKPNLPRKNKTKKLPKPKLPENFLI